MDAIRIWLCRLATSERGATAIEYGLIAALIVIAMMAGAKGLGGGVGGMWSDISADFLAAT